MITTFIIAAVIGLLIGLISGLLGVGGGSVMVPVFRLVFGMSAIGSTATSLFTIIPTSLSGVVSHIRGKTCAPKHGVAMGIGGALTSTIGVQLAQISPSWAVMTGTALVIIYSSSTMLRKALKMPRVPAGETPGNEDGQPGTGSAPYTGAQAATAIEEVPEAPEATPKTLLECLLIGAAAGVASGYVGLGGGFLMVPLMISVMHMPMKLTSGTSLIAIIILAIPAAILQCCIGNVDFVAGIATACGSIPGAFIGAKFVPRVPERTLRFGFAAFLGFAACMLVANELWLLR